MGDVFIPLVKSGNAPKETIIIIVVYMQNVLYTVYRIETKVIVYQILCPECCVMCVQCVYVHVCMCRARQTRIRAYVRTHELEKEEIRTAFLN